MRIQGNPRWFGVTLYQIAQFMAFVLVPGIVYAVPGALQLNKVAFCFQKHNKLIALLMAVYTVDSNISGCPELGNLATCNSGAGELTSHTLFKDGDVNGQLYKQVAAAYCRQSNPVR